MREEMIPGALNLGRALMSALRDLSESESYRLVSQRSEDGFFIGPDIRLGEEADAVFHHDFDWSCEPVVFTQQALEIFASRPSECQEAFDEHCVEPSETIMGDIMKAVTAYCMNKASDAYERAQTDLSGEVLACYNAVETALYEGARSAGNEEMDFESTFEMRALAAALLDFEQWGGVDLTPEAVYEFLGLCVCDVERAKLDLAIEACEEPAGSKSL